MSAPVSPRPRYTPSCSIKERNLVAAQLRDVADQMRHLAEQTAASIGDRSLEGVIQRKLAFHEAAQYLDDQASKLDFSEHAPIAHTDCDRVACMFCEGGLFGCSVCGSFEGATTTDCPGEQITGEQRHAVYAGELDYYGHEWVARCSPSSPAWFHRTIPEIGQQRERRRR